MYPSYLPSFPCTYHTLSVSHVPITPCQFLLYLIHLVSFSCIHHTLSVSHVPITPHQFLMYPSYPVSFPCTYHILSISHVPITPRQFLMYSSHITIILFRFQSWLININILHCTLPLNCVILYKYDMRSCLENYIYLSIHDQINLFFFFLGIQRRMCKLKCKRSMYAEIHITSFLILNWWLVTLQSISNDVPIFLSYKSKTYNRILK
jgi:hypothetical protein